MENKNPATPAPQGSATPGSNGQGQTPPSSVTPPTTNNGAQGDNTEGKVTISTKEYAELQRAKARQLSFERRAQFNKTRNNPNANTGDPDDPAQQAITAAETRAAEAEKRAMQAEVRGKVRDLLDKDEFKNLPKSTKELILKNPHMLSNADNLDEAMLDIEDFVRDQVAGLEIPNNAQPGSKDNPPSGTPKGHETPRVNAGAPSETPAAGIEDTSNLRGVQLSRATLRNVIRKARQGNRN